MAASDTLVYTVTSGTTLGSGAPAASSDTVAGVGSFTAGTTFVGSGAADTGLDFVTGPPGFYQPPAGVGTWVQLLDDVSTRFDIPHMRPPSEVWAVNADAAWVAGRRYQVGMVGEHVTNAWTVETVWPAAVRPAADEFVALLKTAAGSADARLLVNFSAPHGGSPTQLVAEVSRVDQQYSAGVSTVSVTFTRVDPT